MRRRLMLGLLLLMLAAGLWPGAMAASAQILDPGALERIELSGEKQEWVFTPPVNSLYGVYLFPEDETLNATAELWMGDEKLAQGENVVNPLTCRLTAGQEYRIVLSGRGAIRLEVAREALSRCPADPLTLADGQGYSKLIARSGDVHWYSIAAESDGAAMLVCAPEQSGLRMQGWLFSQDGRMLGRAETLASGTAALSAEFESGQTYLVRLAGYGGGTGKYALSCLRSENAHPAESVRLSDTEMEISGYASQRLEIATVPEDACDLVYLDSSDFAVARGWNSGFVEGNQSGRAVITAYAYGGARSTCRVVVAPVAVQDVQFTRETLTLEAGASAHLAANLIPANTTDRQLVYASTDESILTVDGHGVVTALQPGQARVLATAQGGAQDAVEVTVEPAKPRYRALLIGEQAYAPTVETEREGSVKSVEGMMSLLNSASFDGGGYQVTMLMDAARDDVLAAVRSAFANARDADVSLVYITCHGFYQAGMTFFLMADGSVLSAYDLERALRVIPGEIVLLVDCCGSGGVLGEASAPEDILQGVNQVFSGAVGAASVRGSKYRVIASAYLDQDSYRIGFGDAGMTTVFARALCDAAGWNIDLAAPSAMNADANYDGRITLAELESYLSRRIPWYLNLAGNYTQTTSVYPQADPSILFARTSE